MAAPPRGKIPPAVKPRLGHLNLVCVCAGLAVISAYAVCLLWLNGSGRAPANPSSMLAAVASAVETWEAERARTTSRQSFRKRLGEDQPAARHREERHARVSGERTGRAGFDVSATGAHGGRLSHGWHCAEEAPRGLWCMIPRTISRTLQPTTVSRTVRTSGADSRPPPRGIHEKAISSQRHSGLTSWGVKIDPG